MAIDEAFWLRVLGRERIAFDTAGAAQLVGDQTVLITGAGGTIGRSLVAACLDLGARRIVALDQSEYALYGLKDLPSSRVHPILGSVLDELLLDRLLMAEPSVVFHAAAVKHVGFAEHQPAAAAKVNVGGSIAVHGLDRSWPDLIKRAVLVSSDKAAAPRSMMGMSKRVAEAAWTAWGRRGIAIRPVNVIGSSGSVGETFVTRMLVGMPVQAADASRMFMTAGETAAMILEAAAIESPTAMVAYPYPAPTEISMRALATAIGRELGLAPSIEDHRLTSADKEREVLRDDVEGLSIPISAHLHGLANLGDARLARHVATAAEMGSDRSVRELFTKAFGAKELA